jgi:hypothetical protein
MLVSINSMLGMYGETMVFQRLKNQREMSILRTEMEGKLALKSISFTLCIYTCRIWELRKPCRFLSSRMWSSCFRLRGSN